MNLLPGLKWLRFVTPRRSTTHPMPDPGDMGTAFGLDASMEHLAGAKLPEAPPPQAGSPWSRRLVRRPQR